MCCGSKAMHMEYPKLKDVDNLSRKLTDEEIAEIQNLFAVLSVDSSKTSVRNMLARKYNVSYFTIYYWTNAEYRKMKREQNNKYWSEVKNTDYERWYEHKKQEIGRRRNRMLRNPELKVWNEVVSAKNEKRHKRVTVKGKKLEEY